MSEKVTNVLLDDLTFLLLIIVETFSEIRLANSDLVLGND